MAKPFDFVNEMVGKDIVIGIKGNREIKGKLVAYDIHLNLSLIKATMKLENGAEINVGKMFLRGDSIIYMYAENA